MKLILESAEALFSLFYPNLCKSCYSELYHSEEVICLRCWQELIPTEFHTYAMNDVARKLWGRFYFNRAAAGFYFHKVSGIQQMLHEVKYRQNEVLGIELGKRLAQSCMSNQWLEHIDCIIPVPLSAKKKKQRGYNQSEVLARGIQEVIPIPIDTQSLIRKRETETQTKKNIEDRRRNVQEAFALTDHIGLQHKHVLLVDDVLTTGATIVSCATELLKSEGTAVSVLTLAYALEY